MTPSTALVPYEVEVAQIRENGLTLAGQAEALVITDDETDAAAKTVLAAVTKALKRADERRKEVKAPALAECTAIDAAFKDATEPYQAAKRTLAQKTGAYFTAKREAEETARREAERLEREEAAARARLATELGLDGPAASAEPPAKVEKAEAVTRTEAMVRVVDFRVTDETQIPRKFWELDHAAIRRAFQRGESVPGCEEVITYAPRVS